MAKGLNKVLLIGHLGKDPELKYTEKGTARCSFSIATNESYKDDDGNLVDRTEWHNIVVWKKFAEICSQYLKKGSKIYAEGKLGTRSYEQDGIKKYITEITLTNMVMLDKKEAGGGDAATETTDSVKEESTEDDLPF